jgi:ADP-dependent NAD(P)H-hydrate dehydratase / NAD(P)H-hydrate epimerase
MSSTLKLYSTEQARQLDANATQNFGIASAELMARAARAAAHFLLSRWPLAQRIDVICGSGNNGGDGYVVAALLKAAIRDVRVFAYGTPDAQKAPDAFAARAAYLVGQGVLLDFVANVDQLAHADLVVDALFGIGGRMLSGALANAVTRLNELNKTVLALDIPSGLDSDSGHASVAIRATETMSFIVPKFGLYNGQARRYVGTLHVHDLALPTALLDSLSPVAYALLRSNFASSQRDPLAHKGRFGHVWAVGGALGMGGAIALCAQAALRVGAGLVSVVSDPEHRMALLITQPEIMWLQGQELPKAGAGDVLAIGPGLGQGAFAQTWLAQALGFSGARVCDADALNLLASLTSCHLGAATVITPHPGEAARLLRCSVAEVEADRAKAVLALATRFGCVAVLKGAATLVAAPDQAALNICQFGNPGMASGGMGDVLTGVIAGLMAQGLSAFDAATQGVLLHAQAADAAARAGTRGLLASDVISQLRQVGNAL